MNKANDDTMPANTCSRTGKPLRVLLTADAKRYGSI